MVEWALLNSWCLSHRPPESSDAACSWSLRRFSMLCPPEASIQRRLYNDGAFSGPFALLMRYFISEWRLRFPRSLYTSSVWRLDYRLQCLCRNVMELKYGEGGKGTHSKQQRTIQYRISEFEIWLLIWILKYVIWQLCLIDYWTPLRLLTARISIQQLIRSSSVVWSECAPHCPLESPLNELSLKRPRMFYSSISSVISGIRLCSSSSDLTGRGEWFSYSVSIRFSIYIFALIASRFQIADFHIPSPLSDVVEPLLAADTARLWYLPAAVGLIWDIVLRSPPPIPWIIF